MIVNGFLVVLTSALSAIFSVLPSWSLPSWISSGAAFPSGIAADIGGLLQPIRPYFPIDTILTVMSSVFGLWPVILAYMAFEFVWRHIPTIAGFGTGDG